MDIDLKARNNPQNRPLKYRDTAGRFQTAWDGKYRREKKEDFIRGITPRLHIRKISDIQAPLRLPENCQLQQVLFRACASGNSAAGQKG
jgi:hypothetical protein